MSLFILPPVTSGVPVVENQPHSFTRSFPFQSVSNSGECICTYCLVVSAAVVTASCMGGVLGGAVSSQVGMVMGVEYVSRSGAIAEALLFLPFLKVLIILGFRESA